MHQSLQWTITPKCGGSFTRLFQLQQTSLMGERLVQKCCEKIGPNPHPGCPSTRPGTGFGPRHLERATNPRAPQFLGRSFFATRSFLLVNWLASLNQTVVVIKSSNHLKSSVLSCSFHFVPYLCLQKSPTTAPDPAPSDLPSLGAPGQTPRPWRLRWTPPPPPPPGARAS